MSETQATVTSSHGFDISSNFETPDEMQQAVAIEPVVETPAVAEEAAPVDATATEDTPPPEQIAEKPDRRTRDGKKKSIQAEIDELTAKRGQTQAEFEATQARLAEARAELAQVEQSRRQPTTAVPPAADDPEPKIEDFLNETDVQGAYYRAVARWDARQEARKHIAAETARMQHESAVQARRQGTLDEQRRTVELIRKNQNITDEAAFLKTISPAVLALNPIGLLPPGQAPTGETAIADSILASSVPDRILLRFTEQPDELTRIAALPPHLALREMGILEGQLRAVAANHGPAPISRYSTAPAPTKPLGGSPVVSASADEPVDGSSPSAFDRFATAARARRLKEQSRR